MDARSFIARHAPVTLLDRALISIAAHCIWLSARLRARRAFRRWSTPESAHAYHAGKTIGAMQGVLYTTAVIGALVGFLLFRALIR